MIGKPRVYWDHAATSWPKSANVIQAMTDFIRDCGAAAGRGGYGSAAEADRIVTMTRRLIANLINAESSDSISFHSNGTAALNAAIHGVLRHGDHVVTCAAEHNSVLRPLHFLESQGGIRLTIVPVDANGHVDPQQLVESVDSHTRLVAVTHASNVTGAVQPVAEIASALADQPCLFLCDAAQTFGVLRVDVSAFDMLAAPGHKASGGPLGTAFLYAAPSAAEQLIPSVQGGTGSQSERLEMPTDYPSKLEAGNLNVPALAGWAAALQELDNDDLDRRQSRASQLAHRLHAVIGDIPGLRTYGQAGPLPIASIGIDDVAPTDVAVILDAEYGIETRAGMHCAAAIHPFIGSDQQGTLRISGGPDTPESDLDELESALRSIARAMTL